MDINVNVKSNLRIRAFYLFYIIVGVQIGVGIIGAPRFIFVEARQDSWISIIMTFAFMAFTVLIMLAILKQYNNADIFGIQVDLFGTWIGKLLGTIYILYLTISFLSILLTYIEVVQLFLYHTFPRVAIAILLLTLTVYTVSGGFRVVIGIMFLFFFLAQWLIFLLYEPMLRMNWYNLLPMFQASIPELLQGVKATTYTISGFEILFLIYPFIQDKKKAKIPLIVALGYSSLLLLITTVISIGYFSPKSLEHMDWSVLYLFKSVSLTFFERLDYIVVVEWMMVILPNLTILMWAITYGVKRLYKVPQKTSLYIVSILLLITTYFFKYDYQINNFTSFVSQIGFWIIFIYPMVLLPIVLIKKKLQKRKRGGTS